MPFYHYFQGEAIDLTKAVEMISRSSTAAEEGTDAPDGGEEEEALNFEDMSKALPKGGSQRQKIKARDWKSSVAAYNDL